MNRLRGFPFTIAAALLTITCAAAIAVTGADLIHIEFFVEESRPVHKFDELAAAGVLLVCGFGVDRAAAARRLRRVAECNRQEAAHQAERLDVLRATVRTVHEIMNTFMTGVQWVSVEEEEALAPETLDLLNALIADTSAQLKALGELDRIDVRPMALGAGIAFEWGGRAAPWPAAATGRARVAG